jgi:hypothetical protein
LDVRNSPFLRHLDAPQFSLTTEVEGSTTARLASEPGGIDCPGTCTSAWDAGTQVTLVPTETSTRSRFARWSGACTGTAETCTVVVNAETTVTATFTPLTLRRLTLVVSVRGPGRVAGTVAYAGGVCRRQLAPRSVADLRALPATGAHFVGWTGACHGRG